MPITEFFGGLQLAWLCQLLVLTACAARPPPALDGGGPAATKPDAGVEAAAVALDAGPVPIPGVTLAALPEVAGTANAGEAGGEATTLDLRVPDASVPDSATIRFRAEVALEDFRVRVLTDDDRLVPNHALLRVSSAELAAAADGGGADGGAEPVDGAARTEVLLEPTPFWPPRGCCRLVVDGQTAHAPTGSGQRFLPFEASFSVNAYPTRLAAALAARQRVHRRRRR